MNRPNPNNINLFCKIFSLLLHHIFHCKNPKTVVFQAFLFFSLRFFLKISEFTLLVVWFIHMTEFDRILVKVLLFLLFWVFWFLFFFFPLRKKFVLGFRRTGTDWIWAPLNPSKKLWIWSTSSTRKERILRINISLTDIRELILADAVQCSQSPFSAGVDHKCSSSQRISKKFS